MNAIDLLIADHNRVRGLFKRFREAKEKEETKAMVELAGMIVNELEVHTTIEEEIFYPAVRDTNDEISGLVDEGLQEHHVVKVLIEELAEVEPAQEVWVAKMTVLIENVEHHAEEEEKDMFPPLRSSCEADMVDHLADQLEKRKAALGAPVLADKIDLTKDELVKLAQEQEIPGRSQMSHDELAATVAPS
ncbi:MAG: hemerythrin domain-containing protein [Acidimicrobiales bacterium]